MEKWVLHVNYSLVLGRLQRHQGYVFLTRPSVHCSHHRSQIWMKSAVFERQQGNIDIALNLLEDALKSYPKFGKLYMIKGQILQSQQKYDEARATFATGTKACPKEIPLWILASRLEEEAGRRVMARSLLNKARALNPQEPLLWMESVQLEERDGAMPQAKVLISKGWFSCVVRKLPLTNALFRPSGLPYIRHSLVNDYPI
jgi:pre-mRNA-processing factor 6